MKNSFIQYRSERGITRAVARAVARRQIEKMKKDDLPEYLLEPLEFLAGDSVSPSEMKVVELIETIREQMVSKEGEVADAYSEKTSSHRSHSAIPRSLPDIAKISSVDPLWGVFLYLCAKASRARTILEFGAAAGISGCYLMSAPSCERFITIEGSEARARLAKRNLKRISPVPEIVVSSFERGLDQITPGLKDGVDLVFYDGSKSMHTITTLFERLTLHLNPGCLVIVDDIYWSVEMRKTWKKISLKRGVRYAINAGRMGIVVWDGTTVQSKTHSLFKTAGLDLYGIRYRINSFLAGTLGSRPTPRKTNI